MCCVTMRCSSGEKISINYYANEKATIKKIGVGADRMLISLSESSSTCRSEAPAVPRHCSFCYLSNLSCDFSLCFALLSRGTIFDLPVSPSAMHIPLLENNHSDNYMCCSSGEKISLNYYANGKNYIQTYKIKKKI